MLYFFVFSVFFFKQKTAYEMRISDWSSDVCSSDLPRLDPVDRAAHRRRGEPEAAPGGRKTSLGDGRGKDFHRSRTVAAAVHLCVHFKNPSPALALLRLGSRVHLCVQRNRKGESWNIVSWDRRDFAFPP